MRSAQNESFVSILVIIHPLCVYACLSCEFHGNQEQLHWTQQFDLGSIICAPEGSAIPHTLHGESIEHTEACWKAFTKNKALEDEIITRSYLKPWIQRACRSKLPDCRRITDTLTRHCDEFGKDWSRNEKERGLVDFLERAKPWVNPWLGRHLNPPLRVTVG